MKKKKNHHFGSKKLIVLIVKKCIVLDFFKKTPKVMKNPSYSMPKTKSWEAMKKFGCGSVGRDQSEDKKIDSQVSLGKTLKPKLFLMLHHRYQIITSVSKFYFPFLMGRCTWPQTECELMGEWVTVVWSGLMTRKGIYKSKSICLLLYVQKKIIV